MSRFGLRPVLGAAMLFIAGSLSAQESKPPAMNAKMQDLLKRFDKNNDGKIDDDERADAQEVMMKERIEKQVAQTRLPPGSADAFGARMLELFDKNRDGRLDEDERAFAPKLAEATTTGGMATEARNELMKRFDKNGDGKLNEEERGALLSFLAELRPGAPAIAGTRVEKRPEPAAEAMKETEKIIRVALESDPGQRARFDKNKDGRLDDEEWTAARKEIGLFLSGILQGVLDNPTPAEEQKRLEVVAADVARRRELREAAQGVMNNSTVLGFTPEQIEKLRQKPSDSLNADEVRALAVAAEVARRRKLREQAQAQATTTESVPKK